MPLTVTLPLLCALGARIAFTLLNPPLTAPSSNDELIDSAVQGAFQGVLLQYVASDHPDFAPALAFACAARAAMAAYFSDGPADIQALGVAGIAAVVGFSLTHLLSQAAEEWNGVELDEDLSNDRRHSRRRDRELAREARKEHMRARLREINARERERSPSPSVRSRSLERIQPRRTFISRARSVSPRTEHTAAIPPTLITETTSTTWTMEQMGYTGLGRLLDLELANLRKKAASAEADRRRCKEEKKWAIAQGDTSRAKQLAWQVKRYAAMAESYTREADRKIIEATRVNHPGRLSAAAAPEASTPTQDNPYTGLEFDSVPPANGLQPQNGNGEIPYPDYMNQLRKDKGKAPMRSSAPPNANGFGFDSGWQTSKAYA
ncbi:uncharacterized protein FOMMEDRAFT_167928 [Fomitiporia mediterranea MF3/22]|uniref:uncharacterized protein n=1 Tax=Fomitiporia mediterranea (strain MF3/22) TaxID=694068 RepID=UPI0004407BC9|nr:uncharacterized protein FOMMEDRAFT_167928 [Fomitiporia mediterranea MF3/22]EJD02762.1 hypothetical protein FOMMEDRAFT_167928 [Fomitiporia mediterranea MF3/22]